MKILVKDNQNLFEQKLRNNINHLENRFIWDITFDRTSRQVLTLSDGGEYRLSFSRPLYFNFLKVPLCDYEFVFSVEKDSLTGTSTVVGDVRMKRYFILFICFFIIIQLHKIYNIVYNSYSFNWPFLVIMPIVLSLYLIIERFLFIKKVKKIIIAFTLSASLKFG